MKVVLKNIEMICYFDTNGTIRPLRLEEDSTQQVVKISKIIKSEMQKLCGNEMIVYTCSAVINNTEKIFEIKYDIEKRKWMLFKI